jgi:hypothetical protein
MTNEWVAYSRGCDFRRTHGGIPADIQERIRRRGQYCGGARDGASATRPVPTAHAAFAEREGCATLTIVGSNRSRRTLILCSMRLPSSSLRMRRNSFASVTICRRRLVEKVRTSSTTPNQLYLLSKFSDIGRPNRSALSVHPLSTRRILRLLSESANMFYRYCLWSKLMAQSKLGAAAASGCKCRPVIACNQ